MDVSATTIADEATASPVGAQGLLSFWYPILIACFFSVSIAIAVGNGLTVFAYFTSPSLQKSLHNTLICNLSVADLLVAIIGTPAYIMNYTEAGNEFMSTHRYGCLLVLFFMGSAVNLSLVAISLLCLDRFIAVLWPFRYYRIVTDKSVRVAIAISYIISFLPTAPPLFGWNKWKAGNNCGTPYVYPRALVTTLQASRFFIIGLTVVMNVFIGKVAYTKSRTSVADSMPAQEKADAQNQQAAKSKVTKMILTVFGVYYACWIPFMVLTIMYRINTNRPPAFKIAQHYAKFLIGFNSCINPIIYSKTNGEFSVALKKGLRQLSCRQTDNPK